VFTGMDHALTPRGGPRDNEEEFMIEQPASMMTSQTHAGSLGRAPASGAVARPPSDEASRAHRIAQREPASIGGQHVMRGIRAGLIGSAIVALFFGVMDLVLGRPFWTPMALGSVLFRGEFVWPNTEMSAPIVVGYTVFHAATFVVAGLGAARAISLRNRPVTPLRALAYVTGLFAFLEVVFILFARMTEPSLIGAVGTGQIAIANLLSALAITADLVWTQRRSKQRDEETRAQEVADL
jgi:hypothetical protein